MEAPLWTENVRSDDEAEYQVYPRAIATAEVGWSMQEQRHGSDFAKRLGILGSRLALQGVNFYPSPGAAWKAEGAAIDQRVAPGEVEQMTVGTFVAPGSTPSEVSVSIDWGDGAGLTPARVVVDQEPDIVHGAGTYTVYADHAYSRPGK